MNGYFNVFAEIMRPAFEAAQIQRTCFSAVWSVAAEVQRQSNAVIWDAMSEALAEAQREREAMWKEIGAEVEAASAEAEANKRKEEMLRVMRGAELAMKSLSLPMKRFSAVEYALPFQPVEPSVEPAKKGRIGFKLPDEPDAPDEQSPPDPNRRIGF